MKPFLELFEVIPGFQYFLKQQFLGFN